MALNQGKRDLTQGERNTIQTNKDAARKEFSFSCLNDLEPADWFYFTPQINTTRKRIFIWFVIHTITVVLSFVLVAVRRSVTIIIFNIILLIMDGFGFWIYLRFIHSFFLCYVITFWIVIILALAGMAITAALSLEPAQIFIVHVPLILDIIFAIIMSCFDVRLRPFKRAVNNLNSQLDKDKLKNNPLQARNRPPQQHRNQPPQQHRNQPPPPPAAAQQPAQRQFVPRAYAQPLGAQGGQHERVYNIAPPRNEERDEMIAVQMQQEEEEGIELQDKQDLLCAVCMAANKTICFMPCQHVCCCENCAALQQRCPICRGDIQNSFKVYI